MLSRWLAAVLLCCLATVASANTDEWQYTVRPGDTLWNLCQRFAQDPVFCWRELATRSNVDDPQRMQPGKVILIPLAWLKEPPVPALAERVHGEVWLRRPGEEAQSLENGAEIAFGDTIETGDSSSVVVRFADQSEVAIKPSSLLTVDRYRRFVEAGNEPTELRLERGAIRSTVTPRDTDSQVFRVYTPGVMTAVRGTEYHVRVNDQAMTFSEVVEGEVDVSSANVGTSVPAGYGTLAQSGQAPARPVKLLPAPEVTAEGNRKGPSARWPLLDGAVAYQVELYDTEGALLLSEQVETGVWESARPAGEYGVLVRAIDSQGLRGEERVVDVMVPESGAWPWDLMLFIGGAGLLLIL